MSAYSLLLFGGDIGIRKVNLPFVFVCLALCCTYKQARIKSFITYTYMLQKGIDVQHFHFNFLVQTGRGKTPKAACSLFFQLTMGQLGQSFGSLRPLNGDVNTLFEHIIKLLEPRFLVFLASPES